VERAFEGGVNLFFYFQPAHRAYVSELALLLRDHRDDIIVATGSRGHRRESLNALRLKHFKRLGSEVIDVFFALMLTPDADMNLVFGNRRELQAGIFDELQEWKQRGWIRYVGATVHDPALAVRLAADPRVDVLLLRFNMAHRWAASRVFPVAARNNTIIMTCTATRWRSLLVPREGHPDPPSAPDCYRWCLSHPEVEVVLSLPAVVPELEENLQVLRSRAMSRKQRIRWSRYGSRVFRGAQDLYETFEL
jgi:aryl-alcohol dehydrogenase-like predicted oxidoreductase